MTEFCVLLQTSFSQTLIGKNSSTCLYCTYKGTVLKTPKKINTAHMIVSIENKKRNLAKIQMIYTIFGPSKFSLDSTFNATSAECQVDLSQENFRGSRKTIGALRMIHQLCTFTANGQNKLKQRMNRISEQTSLFAVVGFTSLSNCTVLIAKHILLRKVSLSTRAWTQKSCTVSQLVCTFPNPV